jgi:hypothetical protein
VGKTGAVVPEQIGVTAEKRGVACGTIVIIRVVVFAHCPASGVKVYIPVVVLSTVAGLHVPEMPLVDVAGKTGAAVPAHICETALNRGVMLEVTVTVNVVVVPHCPASGVKV